MKFSLALSVLCAVLSVAAAAELRGVRPSAELQPRSIPRPDLEDLRERPREREALRAEEVQEQYIPRTAGLRRVREGNDWDSEWRLPAEEIELQRAARPEEWVPEEVKEARPTRSARPEGHPSPTFGANGFSATAQARAAEDFGVRPTQPMANTSTTMQAAQTAPVTQGRPASTDVKPAYEPQPIPEDEEADAPKTAPQPPRAEAQAVSAKPQPAAGAKPQGDAGAPLTKAPAATAPVTAPSTPAVSGKVAEQPVTAASPKVPVAPTNAAAPAKSVEVKEQQQQQQQVLPSTTTDPKAPQAPQTPSLETPKPLQQGPAAQANLPASTFSQQPKEELHLEIAPVQPEDEQTADMLRKAQGQQGVTSPQGQPQQPVTAAITATAAPLSKEVTPVAAAAPKPETPTVPEAPVKAAVFSTTVFHNAPEVAEPTATIPASTTGADGLEVALAEPTSPQTVKETPAGPAVATKPVEGTTSTPSAAVTSSASAAPAAAGGTESPAGSAANTTSPTTTNTAAAAAAVDADGSKAKPIAVQEDKSHLLPPQKPVTKNAAGALQSSTAAVLLSVCLVLGQLLLLV